MSLDDAYIRLFFLVIARIAGLFASAPVLSSKTISTRIKIALAFWITISLLFVIPSPAEIPQFSFFFVGMLLHDFLLGVLLGVVATIIFNAIEFAGALMDMQMGLSVAQTFDPIVGAQTTTVARLLQFLTIVLFLGINGHHILIGALFESYKLFPIGTFTALGNSLPVLIDVVTLMFFIGFQIASPIVLVIFLLDFSFGIISRVAPQVNVFMLGFQMKPALGLSVLLLLLPLLAQRIVYYLMQIVTKLYEVFAVLGHG